MGWRKILEAEHRLMLEVVAATENECAHIEATGNARADLVDDILGFFRFFCDGLHDPKEDGLLFSRCHKRGMTNDDQPLEQMINEQEWCAGQLDRLQAEARTMQPDDRDAALALAADLREYVDVVRCHIEVEESVFFDTAMHYLTLRDRQELTEEFEAVHSDEVEDGVQAYWEELVHRLAAADSQP